MSDQLRPGIPTPEQGRERRGRRKLSRGRVAVGAGTALVAALAAPLVARGMSGGSDEGEVTTAARADTTEPTEMTTTSVTSTTLAPEAPVAVEAAPSTTAPTTTTTVEAPVPLEAPRIEITADPTDVGAQVTTVVNMYLEGGEPVTLRQFGPGTQATLDGLRDRGITGLTPGLAEGDFPGPPNFIQGVGETPPGESQGPVTYAMNLGGYTASNGEQFAGMQFQLTHDLDPTIVELVIQNERFMPATTQLPGA